MHTGKIYYAHFKIVISTTSQIIKFNYQHSETLILLIMLDYFSFGENSEVVLKSWSIRFYCYGWLHCASVFNKRTAFFFCSH